MSTRDDISGIADASRPNAGRMYDYFLGGTHNFEIDRLAAKEVLRYAPHMPNFLMLIRWFLGEATRRLCKDGFDTSYEMLFLILLDHSIYSKMIEQ